MRRALAAVNALLFLLGLMGCAVPAQNLSPGQLFSSELVNVRAPKSDGWRLTGAAGGGLVFSRRGEASNESRVAQVLLFPLPETRDSEDFIATVKRGIDKDTSPDRFHALQPPFLEYTEARGYPCVKYKGALQDTQAKTSLLGRESLMFQAVWLYCRHPKRKELGFMAGVSHRGENIDSGLEAEADSFIEGVQVPDK